MFIPCSKCGVTGLHACVGRVLPPPTPEEEARFKKVLDGIFGAEALPDDGIPVLTEVVPNEEVDR